MSKAFIFDMDGVLVDSEHGWLPFETPMLERVLGKEMTAKVGDTTGLGLEKLYEKARALGSTITKEEIVTGYNSVVNDVYAHAPLTQGSNALAEKLIAMGFKLGLVTQSPQNWIDHVLPRLAFKDSLEAIISLEDRPELGFKPAPGGYIEALRVLNADPKASFVLEDSNLGIAAGKASGAFTIGFRGNLVESYQQTGADAYSDTMEDVTKMVETKMKA